MRLIDADAFKEYMRKALEETRGCYPDNGEWAEAVTEQFCEDIDDQPTVEPERKKGEWMRHNTYYGDDVSGSIDPDWRCSECGGQANVNAWCLYDLTDFCPHCGADMRKGEGE